MPTRMTLRRSVTVLLLGLAAGSLPTWPAASGAEPAVALQVAVNHAPPYRIIGGEPGAPTVGGLYIEIIEEAAGRAGIELEFIEVPFARALLMMQTGDADLMLGPNRVPEREVYMTFLDVSLPREDKAFYMMPDGAEIASYEDLRGRLIAVLAGAVHFPQFDSDRDVEKEPVNNYLSALRMSARGRVDAAILPELLGDYLVREHDFDVRKAAYRADGRTSYIAMSKKSPELSAKPDIEAALRDMVADGSMDNILARYHGVD